MDGYGVPEIFEKEAHGPLKNLYKDIKLVLKVPIVNFIFRTLALYEDFLFTGWEEVRPNMLTTNMENAACELRYPSISIQVPKIDWRKNYNKNDIETIRKIIFTFNYVNTKLLLIASAWAESFGNRPIYGNLNPKAYIEPGIISGLPEIKLVHVNIAPNPIKELLQDIAKEHQALDVASDFRALANYPTFLNKSWEHLKPFVGSDEYNLISSNLKSKAIKLVKKMDFPVTINREKLEEIYSPYEIAGVMGLVTMYQNFIPGLIIDGEFFRRIIE